jgi:ATP-dependent Clp protease ATP-binding subunit ClpA
MLVPRRSRELLAAVLEASRQEAAARGNEAVEAEHMLLALAARSDLRDLGLDRDQLAGALVEEDAQSLAALGIATGPIDPWFTAQDPRKLGLSTSAKLALYRAVKIAASRGDRGVGAHHLLAGVIGAEQGRVPRALKIAGVDAAALRAQL